MLSHSQWVLPTVNSNLIPSLGICHEISSAHFELCSNYSKTQMPAIAIDWVCLYCLCGSRCVLVFCWLWQAGIFSNLRSCRQTFFSQPSSSPDCSRIHPSFLFFGLSFVSVFFFFLSLSSLLHLSGLELLSRYVVALNLRMKTWIACN